VAGFKLSKRIVRSRLSGGTASEAPLRCACDAVAPPPAAKGHSVIRTVPRHPRGNSLTCLTTIRTPFSRGPGTHCRVPPLKARAAVGDAPEIDDPEYCASFWVFEVHVHELPASASLLVALEVLCLELARWFQPLSSRTPCHCISGSHDVTDRSPERTELPGSEVVAQRVA